jgi:outer membrane receptor for ferrienterochelin and colicins
MKTLPFFLLLALTVVSSPARTAAQDGGVGAASIPAADDAPASDVEADLAEGGDPRASEGGGEPGDVGDGRTSEPTEDVTGMPGDVAGEASGGDEPLGPEPFAPNVALEDHVSVASRFVMSAQRAPAGVTVITADQISAAGYRSVGEALAWVPGLFVSYDLLNYHVGARGLFGGTRSGSRNFRIMINGQPVPFVQSGAYMLGPEFVPMSAVERIEVMLGPASALYGAGALLGAINIVTRRPTYEGEVTLDGVLRADGGLLSPWSAGGEALFSLTGDGWSMTAAGAGHFEDRSGMQVPDGPFREAFRMSPQGDTSRDDTAVPRSFLVTGDVALAGGRLTAQVVGQFSDRAAEFYDITTLRHRSRISLYNVDAAIGYERAFGDGFWLRGGIGFARGGPGQGDQLDVGRTDGRLVQRSFSSTELTANLELLHEFQETGLLLVGVDGQVDFEDLARIDLYSPQSEEIQRGMAPQGRTIGDLGIYSQLQIPVGSALTLSGAARYDYHSVIEHAISARLGATISPSEQLAIKLFGGRSYRAPSPEQLYGNPVPGTLDIVGIPDLPAQYLYSGETVIDWFVTRDLRLVGTGFYNYSDDALAYVSEAGRLFARPFDAHSVGGELRMRYAETYGELVSTDLSAAVAGQQTWTDETTASGFPEKTVPNNESYPAIMTWLSAGIRVLPWRIGLQVSHRYVSSRVPSQSNLRAQGTTDLRYPGYLLPELHLIDVGLTGGPIDLSPSVRLLLSVWMRNMLDTRYSEIGFNGVDVPSLGRSVWVRASLEF